MEKPADTQYPIDPLLADRWSPRAFSDQPVEPEKLRSLMEATRWAASAFNEQPWRFVLVTKNDGPAYDQALACLVEANQAWAQHAPVLLLTFVRTTFTRNDKPNRVAEHDLGLAMGNLSTQATALGLRVHQMAGVDLDLMKQTYRVPEPFEPATAAAIGYPGDPDSLEPGWAQDAERAPRSRNPFTAFVFKDTWGVGSDLFD